jgi:hypothetical protein
LAFINGNFHVLENATYLFLQSSAEVTMEWDNAVVKNNFVVSGYDVYGSVQSKEEGVEGVNFILYSETIKSLDCPTPTEKPVIKNGI